MKTGKQRHQLTPKGQKQFLMWAVIPCLGPRWGSNMHQHFGLSNYSSLWAELLPRKSHCILSIIHSCVFFATISAPFWSERVSFCQMSMSRNQTKQQKLQIICSTVREQIYSVLRFWVTVVSWWALSTVRLQLWGLWKVDETLPTQVGCINHTVCDRKMSCTPSHTQQRISARNKTRKGHWKRQSHKPAELLQTFSPPVQLKLTQSCVDKRLSDFETATPLRKSCHVRKWAIKTTSLSKQNVAKSVCSPLVHEKFSLMKQTSDSRTMAMQIQLSKKQKGSADWIRPHTSRVSSNESDPGGPTARLLPVHLFSTKSGGGY